MRVDSPDMWENEHFSHSSSDGTSFAERMSRYYFDSGYIGENIAAGYGSSAVLYGWMCSAGHRANVAERRLQRLGTGVHRPTTPRTSRGVETSAASPWRSHPRGARRRGDFTVDYGVAGDTVEVVLDGEPIEIFYLPRAAASSPSPPCSARAPVVTSTSSGGTMTERPAPSPRTGATSVELRRGRDVDQQSALHRWSREHLNADDDDNVSLCAHYAPRIQSTSDY